MAEELLEYKCPCCGGSISFDSGSQKMKCPYCDTEFDVETLIEYDQNLKNDTEDQLNWETEHGSEWSNYAEDGMCSFVCNSCASNSQNGT